MIPYLKSIFSQFKTSGTYGDGSVTGSGHIHLTYLVRTVEKHEPDYIIQKINDKVFPPVKEMMNNIEKVTTHIQNKNNETGHTRVLEVISTNSGNNYYTDPEGNHWRMYKKISPGLSYDIVPNTKVAYEAGKAFGKFIADVRDLPANEIFPVIRNFHCIETRFRQFKEAMKNDPLKRLTRVKEEIDFANQQIERMLIIPRLEKEGKLPLRITHNDTKLNNVLFDEHDRAVCVIDLDTVMPGLSLYDFGDTVRTAASTGNEDEADLKKIRFDTEIFKSFSGGFMENTLFFLTPKETENLPLAAQYMTFIMGLRFLTDYIAGDTYYTIHYEKQNIRRCRAQFHLMQCMIESYQESLDIIKELESSIK